MIDKIMKIIAYVESNNNPHAIRFERKILASLEGSKYRRKPAKIITKIQDINKCSIDTARVIYSSSFGKYQIMGFNIYGFLDYQFDIATFLCTEEHQDECVFKFLQGIQVKYDNVFNMLKSLSEIKKGHMAENKSYGGFLKNLSEYLVSHRKAYSDIIDFIQKYNGARFPSTNFFSYLLRMIHFYEKLFTGGV
ncbi:MAG: hypothetical protein QXS69_02675 [Candidatus Aenigmatarchaeota archaeon]